MELGQRYQSWPKNLTMDEAIRNLKNNAHWITIKIKEGYKIFDIGPDITG